MVLCRSVAYLNLCNQSQGTGPCKNGNAFSYEIVDTTSRRLESYADGTIVVKDFRAK